MPEGSLRFDVTEVDTAAVVTARGTLSTATSVALRGVLHKCLAGQPHALVVDLSEVTVADRGALLVLSAVARQASLWPGIPFAVVVSRPDIFGQMRRLSLLRAFRVRPTVEAALDTIGHGEAQPTVRELLPPISGAARHARSVVTEACLRWGFGDQVGPACVVVTELVSNASRHAGTTMTLRVSRRGRWLLLAVEDGGPDLPMRPAMPGIDDEGPGRGLALVEEVSHRWGWLPTGSGKVVWAVLQT